MIDKSDIISKLPYKKPFLFVDEILEISEQGVIAEFTFDKDMDFYKGHFDGYPVTPGVILTEAMAQAGVVCLGIYLMDKHDVARVAMTSSQVEYLKPVFPGEKIIIRSQKIYFRFGKLKCKIWIENMLGEEVCNGVIAGMITQS
ncbi:MAG TPA: hydroxymyristoyl-ACP dehydratase [Flavobacterium sp.]|jgi:3-hydroxyacyl-[acyl-carrier-protein] dehydratase